MCDKNGKNAKIVRTVVDMLCQSNVEYEILLSANSNTYEETTVITGPMKPRRRVYTKGN